MAQSVKAIVLTPTLPLAPGDVVVGIATDAEGRSSEFGFYRIQSLAILSDTPDPAPAGVPYTVTVRAEAAPGPSPDEREDPHRQQHERHHQREHPGAEAEGTGTASGSASFLQAASERAPRTTSTRAWEERVMAPFYRCSRRAAIFSEATGTTPPALGYLRWRRALAMNDPRATLTLLTATLLLAACGGEGSTGTSSSTTTTGTGGGTSSSTTTTGTGGAGGAGGQGGTTSTTTGGTGGLGGAGGMGGAGGKHGGRKQRAQERLCEHGHSWSLSGRTSVIGRVRQG